MEYLYVQILVDNKLVRFLRISVDANTHNVASFELLE